MRALPAAALALLLAGCVQWTEPECGRDAVCGVVPDRWRMDPGVRVGPWDENLTETPGLRVEGPREAAGDARLAVTVTNGLDRPLLGGGSDCGLFAARPTGEGWLVFAAFPGNFQESLLRVEPGATCRADVDLASLTGSPLEPGAHRLVVLLREGELDGPVRLGWAPLQVR
ncbi:MAG TPA: hypothetical protein VNX21_03635 [Candidatus Thermoplasmatota archaeon]|nr:hypothetical protein [Candidatus Thermoplasmatota archaeon]